MRGRCEDVSRINPCPRIQFLDTEESCAKSPITNYSERDLVNMVRGAGFAEIHLQLHIDATPSVRHLGAPLSDESRGWGRRPQTRPQASSPHGVSTP